MKKAFIVLATSILISGFYSCDKTDSKTALCNNGIKDGGETDIDCGGPCQACPDAAAMYCTLGTSSYVSTATSGQILGPSIRVYGNDPRPLNFMFVPAGLNQPIPITSVSFAYRGEAYAMAAGDSGRVVLTELDTVRKIASGTFWFTGKRTTGPDTTSARNGVFTNVRYNN
jgi:hypothetical protein